MTESGQTLSLIDRKELSLSGIRDVAGFSEEKILLDSSFGGVEITGDGLKIASFNLESGTILITGQIDSIVYYKSKDSRSIKTKGRSMIARILK